MAGIWALTPRARDEALMRSATGGAGGGIALSASDHLYSTGTIVLSGAAGVTVGTAGQTVTISAAAGAAGSQSIGMSNLGNTSGTTGIASGSAVRFLFAGGNNVTLSQSLNGASGTLTISAAAQTVDTLGLYAVGNTTGESSSTTRDARSLSFDGAGAVSVGFSGGTLRISAPVQSEQTQSRFNLTLSGNTDGVLALISSGVMTLAGGNNVTLSQAGNAVTVSAGGGAQSVQTLGLYAVGNTTGESSSTTRDARSISVDGAGIVSVGYSGGTLRISASQSLQTQSRFNLTLDGNTSGALALISSGVMTLAGGDNITLSQAGNAVTVSAGGGAVSVSHYAHNTAALYSSSSSIMANTSVSVNLVDIPVNLTVSRVDVPMSVSLANAANTSIGFNDQSWFWGLYTANGVTLNPVTAGSSSTSYTWVSSTGVYSSLTGQRIFTFPLATALTPGRYYWAMQCSTTNTGTGAGSVARAATIAPIHGTSYTAIPWRGMSALTAATINELYPLQGMNSVSMSNVAQTMEQSQITQSGATAQRANNILIFRGA